MIDVLLIIMIFFIFLVAWLMANVNLENHRRQNDG